MSKLIIYLILTTLIISIKCCPEYTYRPYENRQEVLSRLPDSQQLSNLSLIGTRQTMATIHFWFSNKLQNLTLEEQLNSGVRVFDISVRATSDSFAIHHEAYFLDLMFGNGVFVVIEKFLIQHPKEFVILMIHEEYDPASDVTKTNCQILEDYRSRIGRYKMKMHWRLNDTIGQHRGKVLMATNGDSTFSDCVVDLRKLCLSRNESGVDIEDIWDSVKDLQGASKSDLNFRCFVNDLTHRFDGQPDATAVEGRSNQWNECAAPLNYRMAEFFVNPHRALVIVIADFVTQDLIDRINNSN